jgi:catechol 2,3-dioxygenase-like lactoylglutathione lyase family enzyme
LITGLDFVSLPVADMARARAFYEGTLGLTPASGGGEGWMEYDVGDGPTLALMNPAHYGQPMVPVTGGAVGLAFRDFTGMAEALRAQDKLAMDPFETDGCHGGPAFDSEGNHLVLHQRKDEPRRDRVIDFVMLPVENMARARAFYEGTLGLTLDSEGRGIWSEYVLPDGSALALFQNESFEPATGGEVGLRAPDLEDTFARLKAAGFAQAEQVLETPVCFKAFVRDSEGNSLVLHRHK